MSIQEILLFFFKHIKIIIGVFLGVVTLTTAFAYLFPQSYKATAMVLVEATKAPTLRTERQYGIETAQVLFTEIEIVKSRAVMEGVVDQLDLDEPPVLTNPIAKAISGVREWLVSIGLLNDVAYREKMILMLLEDVGVDAVLDTNVFSISFSDQSAQRATAIVNAVSEHYIKRKQEIYSYRQELDYLLKNVEQAKFALDESQQQLDELRESEPDLAALDAKRDTLVQESSRLEINLNDLRLDLTDTLSRYAPSHQKSKVIYDKISLVEDQIARTEQRIQQMEAAKNDIALLQSVVDGNRRTYQSYKQQYDEALPGALADQALNNSRIMDKAPVPGKPRFPRLVFVAVAVVGGAMLGLLLALIKEYFDDSVETPEDVENIMGIPVLGSLRTGEVT